MTMNILLAGMGGQGLVLTTDIICQAALGQKYDVKSNDVVGLSQRGGMVWGNVKYGNTVHSPNIKPGHGDIVLALEPLEGYRWSSILKDNGTIIMNSKKINPVLVQQEKEEYPQESIDHLSEPFQVIRLNAFEKGVEFGKSQVANVILLGILAKLLETTDYAIEKNVWLKAIKNNVPQKAIEMNEKAFEYGYALELN